MALPLPWAPGLLGTWGLGILSSWAFGLLGLRPQGSWAPGLLGSWAPGPLGSALGPWALRPPGSLGSLAPWPVGSWAEGPLDPWNPGPRPLRPWDLGLLVAPGPLGPRPLDPCAPGPLVSWPLRPWLGSVPGRPRTSGSLSPWAPGPMGGAWEGGAREGVKLHLKSMFICLLCSGLWLLCEEALGALGAWWRPWGFACGGAANKLLK